MLLPLFSEIHFRHLLSVHSSIFFSIIIRLIETKLSMNANWMVLKNFYVFDADWKPKMNSIAGQRITKNSLAKCKMSFLTTD